MMVLAGVAAAGSSRLARPVGPPQLAVPIMIRRLLWPWVVQMSVVRSAMIAFHWEYPTAPFGSLSSSNTT